MELVGKEIINSFRTKGYFLLELEKSLLSSFHKLCIEFYDNPLEVRLRVLACKQSGILGYYPSYIVSADTKSLTELKHFPQERQRGYSSFDFVGEDCDLLDNSPLFPMNMWINDDFREKALGNYSRLKKIALAVMSAICEEFSLPHDQWRDCNCFSMMRLLLYSKTDYELTSKEHTDYEFISIIISDAEGLEVNLGNGWVEVPYSPDKAIVLPGDMLEVASSGAVKSVLHRVRCKGQLRRTTILFLGPPLDYKIDYRIDNERILCSFKEHLQGLLLRSAEHLQDQIGALSEQMKISVPKKNLFKRSKGY